MSHIQKIRNRSKQIDPTYVVPSLLVEDGPGKKTASEAQSIEQSTTSRRLVRFSCLRIRLWDECDLQILPSQHDLSQPHIHNVKIEIARNVRMGMGVPSNCERVGEPLK